MGTSGTTSGNASRAGAGMMIYSIPHQMGIFILSAAVILSAAGCDSRNKDAPPRPPAPVVTALAETRDVPIVIEAVGTVQPSSTVKIKAKVSSRVRRIVVGEGRNVEKGQVLIELDSESIEAALAQAEATLLRDTARADHAAEQARRYRALLKDEAIAADAVEQAESEAAALKAQIALDNAVIKSLRIDREQCTILAPITGRTGEYLVHEGDLVKAYETNILTVHALMPVHVAFSVPESYLGEIKARMAGSPLKVEARLVSGQAGPDATGTLDFLDNQVDTATGTIALKGVFANRSQRLWPGAFVAVRLVLDSRTGAVVVPESAVQTGQQGDYVFVVTKDSKAELRVVQTGPRVDGLVAIERGLGTGEQVVTEGHLRVLPGGPVTPRKPD